MFQLAWDGRCDRGAGRHVRRPLRQQEKETCLWKQHHEQCVSVRTFNHKLSAVGTVEISWQEKQLECH